jgi:transposase
MTRSSMPSLPPGVRHESLFVGAAPLVRHFLDKLGLPALFDRHLPQLRGRQRHIPTSTILCVMLSNLLLARQPLYGMPQWTADFVPEYLGLLPQQLALLNDDRFGRTLDHLFRADRASLLTAAVLAAKRIFALTVDEMHQDTTSITFSGEYANQPPAEQSNRPARITRGYNKDHRPDLKQLLYNRTVTSDGAVPIHCKIHDGNVSDSKVHKRTWLDLCVIVGSANFLYVADSKLCDRKVMRLIARRGGRFLTVLPRTRGEHGRFLDWVRQNDVDWSEVCRKKNPRSKAKPRIIYRGWEDPRGGEGDERIFWYHSSQKQERDFQARMKRVKRCRQRLERLRPPGRGQSYQTKEAAQEAVGRILEQYPIADWLTVSIEEVVEITHFQMGRGRPGANTSYGQGEIKSYEIRVTEDEAALQRAKRCDGVFALISNDKSLDLITTLQKYKYQPYAEKRHQQLKSVFKVRPVWLKNGKRVESFLWLYHMVEVMQSLLEREVRKRMVEVGVKSLALRPEGRQSEKPTCELVLKAFQEHKRHRLLSPEGVELYCFHDPVSEVARSVLNLLRIDSSAYGIG